MSSARTIEELTKRNVAVIAQMERASQGVRTRGERLADAIAAAVGSWAFILIQTALLLTWLTLNVVAWVRHWDPYPFILLNLALSFQSAYAAPILMISQNRQAKLSERRNHLDLQINMLAEQESTETLRLLRLLCERSGIHVHDADESGLEEETRHDRIVEQIEAEIEAPHVDRMAGEIAEKADVEPLARVAARAARNGEAGAAKKAAEKIAEKTARKITERVVEKVDEKADPKPAAKLNGKPAGKTNAKPAAKINGDARVKVEKADVPPTDQADPGSRRRRTRR